jgi:hypothetical protein
MKKILFTLVFISSLTMLQAQLVSHFGLRAGFQYNLPSIQEDSASSSSYQAGLGYQIMINSRWSLSDNLMFGTGLGVDFRQFGTTSDFNVGTTSYNLESRTSFTNLDLNLGLVLMSNPIGDGTYLFAHLGTNILYNLTNRLNQDEVQNGNVVRESYRNVDDFSRFNVELRPKIGVIFKSLFGKFELAVAYQRSLLNIYTTDNINGRWDVFSAEFGYYF